MSERFERAIQDWYDHARTANLEYLNLSEVSHPKLKDIRNNIDVIYDHLNLSTKVIIKHLHDIKLENSFIKLELVECKQQIKKNQKESHKALQQISSEVRGVKPLTKAEVLVLVEEIAQQPKKVEEEALRLTTELEKKIHKVDEQVHKVERLLKEVQQYATS